MPSSNSAAIEPSRIALRLPNIWLNVLKEVIRQQFSIRCAEPGLKKRRLKLHPDSGGFMLRRSMLACGTRPRSASGRSLSVRGGDNENACDDQWTIRSGRPTPLHTLERVAAARRLKEFTQSGCGLKLRNRVEFLKCRGESVRQAPHRSRFELQMLRTEIEVVYSSCQMPRDFQVAFDKRAVDRQLCLLWC